MRKTWVLLGLLQDFLKKDKSFLLGLCFETRKMQLRGIITEEEDEILQAFINRNRPGPDDYLYEKDRDESSYYWKTGVKAPRLKWLAYHKKLLKILDK